MTLTFIAQKQPDNRSRLNYDGEIWKRKFHRENASNVSPPHYAGGISKRNGTIIGYFGFAFEENSDRKMSRIS